MSRFSMGPAPQPYQRRTAKNVIEASSLPVSSRSVTVVSSLTRASTAGPLGASRIADVQNASRSSALCFAANSHASRTNSISSCWPASLILPSASRNCTSESGRLCEANGTGRAPGWASTKRRWTVFEPISRTPRRIGPLLSPEWPGPNRAPCPGPPTRLGLAGVLVRARLLVGWLEVAADVGHAFRIDFETVDGTGVDNHAKLVAKVADDRRALGAEHVRRRGEVLLGDAARVREDGQHRLARGVRQHQRLDLGIGALDRVGADDVHLVVEERQDDVHRVGVRLLPPGELLFELVQRLVIQVCGLFSHVP